MADKEILLDKNIKEQIYQSKLIKKVNPDISYSDEVVQLANEINIKHFKNGSIDLFSDI